MVNVADSSAILGIKHYSELYSNNLDTIKQEYRKLSKVWHPDANTEECAPHVFAKLTDLYNEAKQAIGNNRYTLGKSIRIERAPSSGGKSVEIKYIFDEPFELGHVYIANTVIAYVIEQQHKKFYTNAVENISELKYESPDMEKEFKRYMPSIITNFQSADGKYVIVISKHPNVVRLKDILTKCADKVKPETVVWMVGAMLNLSCYLDFYKLSLNAFTLENLFISPEHHTIMIYGGWWYLRAQGEKLLGVPKRVYSLMPMRVKASKLGSIETDIESIKDIGRQLIDSNKLDPRMVKWLRDGSSGTALENLTSWYFTADNIFGKRQFIQFNVDSKEIYN